jgi:DNA relaxase NicK
LMYYLMYKFKILSSIKMETITEGINLMNIATNIISHGKPLATGTKTVKVYNNIDNTSYEIIYSKLSTDKNKQQIYFDEIMNRILHDLVRFSKRNKIRSDGLNFDSAYVESSENLDYVHLHNDKSKSDIPYYLSGLGAIVVELSTPI